MTDINRRNLLRDIGAATGTGIAGLSLGTSAVSASSDDNFTKSNASVMTLSRDEGKTQLHVRRQQLHEEEAESVIEAARNDRTFSSVQDDIANTIRSSNAKAYQISFEWGQDRYVTDQLVAPMEGNDEDLIYASTGQNSATKAPISNNKTIQSIDFPDDSSGGRYPRQITIEENRLGALRLVRQDSRYRQWQQRLPSEFNIRVDKTRVVDFENQNRTAVIVPAVKKNRDGPSLNDRVMVGVVDTDSRAVESTQNDLIGCLLSCGATSTTLMGICYTDCLVLSAGVACIACLGVQSVLCSYCFV